LKALWLALRSEAIRLDKGGQQISGILQEISRLILAVTGVKRRDFIKSINDELRYRIFCFEVARDLKTKNSNNYTDHINSIRVQFQKEFNVIPNKDGMQVNVQKSLEELLKNNIPAAGSQFESCYSTIHSAKGLESTSALAIAYSDKEINKWLDFEAANSSIDDDYRLGYVAFSRARDMLCIACLETLSVETEKKLASLGIVFYPA
jgi:DNA helicase II / ATP-dependent DNA helicase PcrA